jgi:predicted aspartyl protease
MVKLPRIAAWLAGVVVALALTPAGVHSAEPSPNAVLRIADGPAGGCGTSRMGEITVAALRNAPLVTLSANGHPVTLLLDTGAEWTILTPPAAQRVGAEAPRVAFDRQVRGIGATLGTREVELRSFNAGSMAIPWRRVRVAAVNITSVFSGPLDGVLGADTLSSFDIELDVPRHRLVFYTKQTCPAAAPAWTEPFLRIAAGRSLGNHLFFPVQLDGHRLDAFIDTGAQLSALSTRAARSLGLTEAILARDRTTVTVGAAAERLNSRVHRFARLEFGAEIVRNPEIVVADFKLSDADLVLGMDFLAARRIWLSYGSQQIFLARGN